MAQKSSLTPTGRPRRTMAEIRAEASRKRAEQLAAKARKDAERALKQRTDAAAKELRADQRRERRRHAEAKRIERERKRRERRNGSRQLIFVKSETPHHVFTERLQDDPEKAFYNHIVDSAWDSEDAFVDMLDARRTAVLEEDEVEEPTTAMPPNDHADEIEEEDAIEIDEYYQVMTTEVHHLENTLGPRCRKDLGKPWKPLDEEDVPRENIAKDLRARRGKTVTTVRVRKGGEVVAIVPREALRNKPAKRTRNWLERDLLAAK